VNISQFLPRLVIGALRGGSGKTILALGIIKALKDCGLKVISFKKGPDYIDPFWLSIAAGTTCHNLDLFLLSRKQIVDIFGYYTHGFEAVIVEGNRGIFDGLNVDGLCSTVELAKILNIPMLLILDCSMASRTIAAMVLGCQYFDSGLNIAGIILNMVASSRQEAIVCKVITENTGFPILGVIPYLSFKIPERHMGLVLPQERHKYITKFLNLIVENVTSNINLDNILTVMASSLPWKHFGPPKGLFPVFSLTSSPIIGVVSDLAFGFYYSENIEVLTHCGARLLFCSALSDKCLPKVDALYIGGGFPEVYAQALAANFSFRRSIRQAAETGMPIYAECGGLMYLGKHIIIGEQIWPMVGVFPMDFIMEKKPQGHGYTNCLVIAENPFLPLGCEFRAHEFHYSSVQWLSSRGYKMIFKVLRGKGMQGRDDGILYKNTLGTYHHIHALGLREWAFGMLTAALR